MYAVTSMWFVSRTRATFRSAELGFLGVEVKTRTQTPRFCGDPCKAGLSVLERSFSRPARTSWLTVGTEPPSSLTAWGHAQYGHAALKTTGLFYRGLRECQACHSLRPHTAGHEHGHVHVHGTARGTGNRGNGLVLG